MISKRMTLAMTMIVAALFLSPGVFSADAIKHQHSKTKSAGEASPTAGRDGGNDDDERTSPGPSAEHGRSPRRGQAKLDTSRIWTRI